MQRVAVFGAGGLGRMVLDTLRRGAHYRPVALLDSDRARHGTTLDGVRITGGIEEAKKLVRAGVAGVIVAIGDSATRCALARDLEQRGMQLISAIHPLASISPTARLQKHVIIGARVTICVHAQVGAHVVIMPGGIIEHDNVIGDGAFLHPAVRLAGTVTVEPLATLGIGCCVIPGRRIGRGARVAPGAVVIRDVEPGAFVGGVPATLLAESNEFEVPPFQHNVQLQPA